MSDASSPPPKPPSNRLKAIAVTVLLLASAAAIAYWLYPKPQQVPNLDAPSFLDAVRRINPLPASSVAPTINEGLPPAPSAVQKVAVLQVPAAAPGGAPSPAGPPPAAGPEPPAVPEFAWEPGDVLYGQLFPSIELAQPVGEQLVSASIAQDPGLGDKPNSPYYARIVSPAGKKVRLEITCDELMEPSSREVTIQEAGAWSLHVQVKWKFKALRESRQLHPVNITWTLFVDGQPLPSKTRTVMVQPADILPLHVKLPGRARVIECYRLAAAYANEDHPMLDSILAEALETQIISSFSGMQSNDPNEVKKQVLAIWWALQRRGIVYSSISTTVIPGTELVHAQRVRFFDDVIRLKQANCIDGTLVFASLLRRVGLKPLICVTPNHAFLGFYVDASKTQIVYLETTALNSRDFYVAAVQQQAERAALAGGHRHPNPFAKEADYGPDTLTCPATPELAAEMFYLATVAATRTAAEAKAQSDSGRGYFYQVDLAEQRKTILPIPSEMKH